MSSDKNRLIELLKNCIEENIGVNDPNVSFKVDYEDITDYLIASGVIVTPCVAMVEQFIKDGEFDRKRTAHNGRIAVVYVDKSKWNSPLIDITEQFYNTDKAIERIQALEEENEIYNSAPTEN